MAKHPEHRREPAVCPVCGCTYTAYPALSRLDNKTLICPDCGIREALDTMGIKPIEQNEILRIIHRHTAGRDGGNV